MRSVNKVILIGNLTRDPVMRQTPSGQYVTTFGIATNREWINQQGERKSSTEFHDLVAWARLAEICNQYLKKGKLIYVEGYLKTRSWDTPEGVRKFKTEIIIQDMIMLEKRPKDQEHEDLPLTPSDEPEFNDYEIDEDNAAHNEHNGKKEESKKGNVNIEEDLGL